MKIRRVVTAVGADGKSRVVEDGTAPRHFEFESVPGYAGAMLWATPAASTLSCGGDGADVTTQVSFVPAPGETRLKIVTFAPDQRLARADFDPAAFGAELFRLMPGFAESFEPDQPGMHTTDTVDYDVVLDGEITLELDDGQEVLLRRHDVAVQHGTRHAWRNRSDRPATMLFVLVGARRVG